MSDNISQWHFQNIENQYFENDEDFEKLKKSPTKFNRNTRQDSDKGGLLSTESLKLLTSMRTQTFKHNNLNSP